MRKHRTRIPGTDPTMNPRPEGPRRTEPLHHAHPNGAPHKLSIPTTVPSTLISFLNSHLSHSQTLPKISHLPLPLKRMGKPWALERNVSGRNFFESQRDSGNFSRTTTLASTTCRKPISQFHRNSRDQ